MTQIGPVPAEVIAYDVGRVVERLTPVWQELLRHMSPAKPRPYIEHWTDLFLFHTIQEFQYFDVIDCRFWPWPSEFAQVQDLFQPATKELWSVIRTLPVTYAGRSALVHRQYRGLWLIFLGSQISLDDYLQWIRTASWYSIPTLPSAP